MLIFVGLSLILRSSFGHPPLKVREFFLIFALAMLPKNLKIVISWVQSIMARLVA